MAHNVFICYHHANDQYYKNELVKFGKEHKIFVDYSVGLGEIDDNLSDQEIRQIIRDEYLQNSTVTIVLVGTDTKNRKHVDWEIYSSMYDGKINKKSGILVINLPSISGSSSIRSDHSGEKESVFSDVKSWVSISERAEYERRHPYMPDRLIDNFLESNSKISVVNWSDLNVEKLTILIENAFQDRANCKYDLSRAMRRRNS
ncbi:MAG: TIR domain-containing protein [Eubacteriales bacterium]|nr:TIR domain-containing protein [Eubacteriales bacterium]MDD4476341.1 TIR domain-containing protein [Eubacteriales bacterium]